MKRTAAQHKSAQVHWGKLAVKLTVWIATELLLGWVGLDNLADYGEFVLGEGSPALYQIQPVKFSSSGRLDLIF
ncbi:MAG: hypothetical protein ACKO7W_14930 [Elainella sp.]